ncbi:hypothetical protein O3M35_000819 [Rhynocoris fuscipes]|uniref:Uncharacterized protein n=1 Tax=Rhynocoris fuscipes TaxID=488301 RepID=A0AAW1DQS8_9HEMI
MDFSVLRIILLGILLMMRAGAIVETEDNPLLILQGKKGIPRIIPHRSSVKMWQDLEHVFMRFGRRR